MCQIRDKFVEICALDKSFYFVAKGGSVTAYKITVIRASTNNMKSSIRIKKYFT